MWLRLVILDEHDVYQQYYKTPVQTSTSQPETQQYRYHDINSPQIQIGNPTVILPQTTRGRSIELISLSKAGWGSLVLQIVNDEKQTRENTNPSMGGQ